MVAATSGKNLRPLVIDSFAFREIKNFRQNALLVLQFTLVTEVLMWQNDEGQIVNGQK